VINENQPPGKAGGLRKNSHELHLSKKTRKFKCDWCKKSFESREKHARFCCAYHRLRAFQITRAFKERKKLTQKARKLKGFRPPSYRINMETTRRSQDA